ncbi:MAG: PKD domain-containing protein [Planctomycetota bacterium]
MRAISNILGAVMLALPAMAAGESVRTDWTVRYNGPESSYDNIEGLATDPAGNTIVAGYSFFPLSDNDILVAKIDPLGTLVWTTHYNGPANGEDLAMAVTTDAAGNIYVTGTSTGLTTGRDLIVLKYNPDGRLLWENRYNGSADDLDQGQAIATAAGRVYITGTATGATSGRDYATLCYDDAGNLIWANLYDGPGSGTDLAVELALDPAGNVYVTGSSFNNGTARDIATIKYAPDGTMLWLTRYDGPAHDLDEARGVAADAGGVWVLGRSWGVGTRDDMVTLRYDGDGTLLWANRFDGTENGSDQPAALAVDPAGNCYVAGSSYSRAAGFDYVTIKYAPDGGLLWKAFFDGTPGAAQADYARAAAADATGVWVTGFVTIPGGATDFATVRYDASGVPLWETRYSGPAGDYNKASDMSRGARGRVTVAGGSNGIGTLMDIAIIRYSSGAEPPVAEAGPDRTVVLGEAVVFDGTASTDPDGIITRWTWNFGDGAPAQDGATPPHVFGAPGRYTVTLTVTDADDLTASDACAVTVLARPVIEAGPDLEILVCETGAFTASGSDPDGAIAEWVWDFGDGSAAAAGTETSHTWCTPGVYTVTLLARDNDGLMAADTLTVRVLSAEEGLWKLIALIRRQNLGRGIETSYLVHPVLSLVFLKFKTPRMAIIPLCALLHHNEALRGKKITGDGADAVAALTRRIIAALRGC